MQDIESLGLFIVIHLGVSVGVAVFVAVFWKDRRKVRGEPERVKQRDTL